MSEKLKTIKLSGAALDWAVATVEEKLMKLDPMGFGNTANGGWWLIDDISQPTKKIGSISKLGYSPSQNWDQGGPLIEKHQLYTMHYKGGLHPSEPWFSHNETEKFYGIGETLLIAACRAIVVAKFGEFIEVPESLISQGVANEQTNR
ncbi:MAG TPA: DUF2591 domain-containing protein [Pantoea sp.]|nr:DUF2591 domain-containing protein [Pantoea sp.]